MAALGRVLEVLHGHGVRWDDNCGLHVHVGIPDYCSNPTAVASLLLLYDDAWDAIESLLTPARRGNRYCRRTECSILECASRYEVSREHPPPEADTRYVAVNIFDPKVIRYGTVEFRHYMGWTLPWDVYSWVQLLLHMVEAASQKRYTKGGIANRGSQAFHTILGLHELMHWCGMTEAPTIAVGFLTGRWLAVNKRAGYMEGSHLVQAAMRGDEEYVQELLEVCGTGIVQERWDFYQNSALHAAAWWGHVGVAQLLLDAGADPDAPQKDGWTPLWYAQQQRHRVLSQLLRERGARWTKRTSRP